MEGLFFHLKFFFWEKERVKLSKIPSQHLKGSKKTDKFHLQLSETKSVCSSNIYNIYKADVTKIFTLQGGGILRADAVIWFSPL